MPTHLMVSSVRAAGALCDCRNGQHGAGFCHVVHGRLPRGPLRHPFHRLALGGLQLVLVLQLLLLLGEGEHQLPGVEVDGRV